MARPTRPAALGRRHPATLIAAVALAVASRATAQEPHAAASDGRQLRRPFARALLGAAAGTAFLHDDAGVTVRPSAAPVLGVELGAHVDDRTTLAVALRASRPGVDIESGGASWSGGSATLADVGGVVERRVGDRVALRAGAILSYVSGEDDVAPFRTSNDSPFHLGGELGARLRFGGALPLGALVAWHAFRFGGGSAAEAGTEAGVVHRALVGITYGR